MPRCDAGSIWRLFWLLPALLAVLVPACASLEVNWAPPGEWRVPSAGETALRVRYPDAAALHLVDEGRMEIFGQGEVGFSVFTHHRVTRILTTAGQRYAYVVIPYGEESTVTDVTARTITPDGGVALLDPKNIFDVSLYPSFVFFSDQRARIFTMPAVENNAVIEYSYTLTVHSRTLWHGWTFQSDIPVLRSEFTLVRPAEWDVTHRLYGTSLTPRETKGPQGFKTLTEWHMDDVPPLTEEFAMPSARERTMRLALAPLGFRTWNDVGRWYDGLCRPRMRADAAARAKLQRIVHGAATDTEKLRKIYEWVRDNVRYVAVEIGIGGYQPHDANEVCTNLYGDCKDMATLLCMLGREAGLQVDPVLVSTWQNGPPDTSLASPLQFNHVIAYARSAGIWMDPTDKGTPFGHLPWYDQGLPVLPVSADGTAEIQMTPRSTADEQQVALAWDVRLKPNGAAVVRGSTTLTGAAAADLRDDLVYRDVAGRRQWIESYLAARCPGIRLDSMAVRGLDPPIDSLVLSYAFSTPVFATERERSLVLRPGLIHGSDLPDYFRSRARTFPIRFRFGMETSTRLRISGDGPLAATGETDSIRSEFGAAVRSSLTREGVVTYDSRFTLAGQEIPAASYQRFQDFLDAVRAMDLRETLITGAR